MTVERAQRILRQHGADVTAADAARLLGVLEPLARHALRVGALSVPTAEAPHSPAPPADDRRRPRRAPRPHTVR